MKQQNFVIELTEDHDGTRLYVIRSMQGTIIRFASSAEELATFFDEFKFPS